MMKNLKLLKSDWLFAGIIVVLLFILTCLLTSCGVTGKNKSSQNVKRDSTAVTKQSTISTNSYDSSAYKQQLQHQSTSVDSGHLSEREESTGDEIDIRFALGIQPVDSTTNKPVATGKTIKLTKTDNGYEIDPGDAAIASITARSSKSTKSKDSTGRKASEQLNSKAVDSTMLNKKASVSNEKHDSVAVKIESTITTKLKTSKRPGAWLYIIILVIVMYGLYQAVRSKHAD